MRKFLYGSPFLWAIYPVFFLFAQNLDQVSFSDLYGPLAVGLGSTLILGLLLRLVLGEYTKPSVILSIFWVLFFLYGHVFTVVQTRLPGGPLIGKHFWPELIWIAILAGGITLIIRTRKDLSKFLSLLNTGALVLLAMSIGGIAVYQFQNRGIPQGQPGYPEDVKDNMVTQETSSSRYPDIYHIVLDAYAHNSTLQDIYGYDNRQFTDFLVEQGFDIASKSCGNYAATFLSLASSLNMEYINYLSETIGTQLKDQTIPRSMITANKASRVLKSKGYQIVHFNSGWGPTRHNSSADQEIVCGRGNDFTIMLFRSTMLSPWEKAFFGNGVRERILGFFEELAKIPEKKGPKPKYVFAHIISPHPPYLFDAAGRTVPKSDLNLQGSSVWREKEKYVNQLIFINQKVKTLVREILAKSTTAPIIIIQADHGTASTFYEPGGGGWSRPDQRMLRERMRILNAWYLPGENPKNRFYDSISPVNTYRFILNRYFNENYPLLEDRSYYSNYQIPYQFHDVTGQVAFDSE